MSSPEWTEILAWLQLDPLPDPWRIGAQLASVMASAWSKRRFTPDDFMPARRTDPAEPRRLSPEESVGLLGRMFHG